MRNVASPVFTGTTTFTLTFGIDCSEALYSKKNQGCDYRVHRLNKQVYLVHWIKEEQALPAFVQVKPVV